MKVLKKFFGVILCICALGFTAATEQVEQSMQPFFVLLVGLCIFGAIMLLKKSKKQKAKHRDIQKVRTDPQDTDKNIMVFDKSGKFIARADGQPLSDADVSYLVEKGKTEAIKKANEIQCRSVLATIRTEVELNSNEALFFDAFAGVLLDAGLNPGFVSLQRLSSGVLNVMYYAACYIGKIHISADKQEAFYMQCLDRTGAMREYRNISLNTAIDKLPIWMRYAKFFMQENKGTAL